MNLEDSEKENVLAEHCSQWLACPLGFVKTGCSAALSVVRCVRGHPVLIGDAAPERRRPGTRPAQQREGCLRACGRNKDLLPVQPAH